MWHIVCACVSRETETDTDRDIKEMGGIFSCFTSLVSCGGQLAGSAAGGLGKSLANNPVPTFMSIVMLLSGVSLVIGIVYPSESQPRPALNPSETTESAHSHHPSLCRIEYTHRYRDHCNATMQLGLCRVRAHLAIWPSTNDRLAARHRTRHRADRAVQ